MSQLCCFPWSELCDLKTQWGPGGEDGRQRGLRERQGGGAIRGLLGGTGGRLERLGGRHKKGFFILLLWNSN